MTQIDAIPKDIDGNDIPEVFVSEGTRNMSRGIGDTYKAGGVGLLELQTEADTLKVRKNYLQVQMSELNNRVRGRKLSLVEYRQICGMQTEIKREIAQIEERLMQIKPRLQELRQKSDPTNLTADQKNGLLIQLVDLATETNSLLRELIRVTASKR